MSAAAFSIRTLWSSFEDVTMVALTRRSAKRRCMSRDQAPASSLSTPGESLVEQPSTWSRRQIGRYRIRILPMLTDPGWTPAEVDTYAAILGVQTSALLATSQLTKQVRGSYFAACTGLRDDV